MDTISLLILTAIAGFLFYQLRSVLGQTPPPKDKEKSLSRKKMTSLYDNLKKSEKSLNNADIVQMPKNFEHRFIKVSLEANFDTVIDSLNKIKLKYPEFDLNKFIEGSKKAYDMILESFNNNLPEDIKNYLNDDIYAGYRHLLDDYANKNYHYQTIVTRIEQAMVTSVETNDISAKITVEFKSHNISSLTDNEGNVIQGDPNNVVAVTDIWVFERYYSSNNSSWIVVSII
jgi:predicted lipid-binding transport protein (Tim44 family)